MYISQIKLFIYNVIKTIYDLYKRYKLGNHFYSGNIIQISTIMLKDLVITFLI